MLMVVGSGNVLHGYRSRLHGCGWTKCASRLHDVPSRDLQVAPTVLVAVMSNLPADGLVGKERGGGVLARGRLAVGRGRFTFMTEKDEPIRLLPTSETKTPRLRRQSESVRGGVEKARVGTVHASQRRAILVRAPCASVLGHVHTLKRDFLT